MSTNASLPDAIRSLFDGLADAAWIVDRGTRRIVDTNPAAAKALAGERELFIGLTVDELFPSSLPDALAITLPEFDEGPLDVGRRTVLTAEGDALLAQMRCIPLAAGAVWVAVIALLRPPEPTVEEEPAPRKGADHLLRLTQAVAYGLNNELVVLSSGAALLGEGAVDSDEWREDLEDINGAITRAGALVNQLQAFEAPAPTAARSVDLDATLGEIARTLRVLAGQHIEVNIERPRRPVYAFVDVACLDQVLLNLAEEAIRTGDPSAELHAALHLDDRERVARIEIHVAGLALADLFALGTPLPAIPTPILCPPDAPTPRPGLSLAAAALCALMAEGGAEVRWALRPDDVAHWTITLPLLDSTPRPSRPMAAFRAPTETLLLVDTHDGARAFARRILERAGYAVLDTSHSGEALLIAETHHGEIHLLITELIIPRLPGEQLAARLREKRPDLVTLGISGHIAESASIHPPFPVLRKPFTAAELRAAVRATLTPSQDI